MYLWTNFTYWWHLPKPCAMSQPGYWNQNNSLILFRFPQFSLYPFGNQPWIFIGKTVAEAEAPILWPPDAKSLLIRKDLDAGKDWRQKEKGSAEDEMVR